MSINTTGQPTLDELKAGALAAHQAVVAEQLAPFTISFRKNTGPTFEQLQESAIAAQKAAAAERLLSCRIIAEAA
eukprot:2890879-Rhodomonas_salina.1